MIYHTLPIPIKDGYVFAGWHLSNTLGNPITQITEAKNITIYARWIEVHKSNNIILFTT